MSKFTSAQFQHTQYDSAHYKAVFANQFAKFVDGGFQRKHFYGSLYRKLSTMFGHIAHYDCGGFYAEFFTTTIGKVRFLQQTVKPPMGFHGDPKFTWSDVECALSSWVTSERLVEIYTTLLAAEVERVERSELCRLKAKYE